MISQLRKNIFDLVFSMLFTIMTSFVVHAQDVNIQEIAAQNLFSLSREPDPSVGDSIQDPYAFYNFLTETIINPQPHDKRKRAFKILASAEHGKAEHDKNVELLLPSLLDETTIHDLNLLCGSKDNPFMYLANILSEGRTHTELGKAYLCGLLARPITDVTHLVARQQMVKKFVEDETLFNELNSLLQGITASETLFTGLWDTELLMQFVEGGYSKMDGIGPVINQSSLCLDMGWLSGACAQGIGSAVLAVSPLILTLYGLSMLCSGEPALNKWTGYCFGQVGLIFEAFPILKNRWAQGAIALTVGVQAALSLRQSLQHMHTNFLFDDFLRRRLVYVAMYGQAAHDILQAVAKSVPEVSSSCMFFSDLERFFNDKIINDTELACLDELLKSDTFLKGSEQEFELFFRRGNMLCAYYLLGTIKTKFESMMAALGELDAFLTIAKLVKESKSAGVQFCFPSYVPHATKPSIQLADFWNPFIDRTKVVLNSIDLGAENGVSNIIVTGPNSAGKSTILKSVALAIICAQSLGVAPARAMALTPFSYVATYMNVADSIGDQESRFQAEARRVFEYGDRLDDLAKKNEFSFALFDEIFSGTSPTEGADLGYKVATILGGYSNCISVVATHFDKLTGLEQDTAGKFINYNVAVGQNPNGSIQFDENNKIKRLFTLTPGVSHQHIAREVFKEKGGAIQSRFFEKCFPEAEATLTHSTA